MFRSKIYLCSQSFTYFFIKHFDRWNSGILNGETTTFVIVTATVAATNATKELTGAVFVNATTVSVIVAPVATVVVSVVPVAATAAVSVVDFAKETMTLATASRKKVCFPNV